MKLAGRRSVESSEMLPTADRATPVGFGPFELDQNRRVLTRDGEPVPVPGKALEILAVLIRHRVRIVGRDELMEAIWPDTFVEESNLTQNVSVLRRALGEGARDPRWVVTVPGRGYRFVGRLRGEEGTEEESRRAGGGVDEPLPRPGLRPAIALGATLLLAAGAWWIVPRGADPPEIIPAPAPAVAGGQDRATRLAVLPFNDLGPEDEDDYLSVALADALIARLARVDRLSVRPTLSILPWADGGLDPAAAASRLEVDAVVAGTFQRIDGRLRLSVQLVRPDGGAGATWWAGRFEREAALRPEIEDAVAEELARALVPRLSAAERTLLRAPVAPSPEAREEVLKARYQLSRRDEASFAQARRHLDKALAADPDSSAVWEVLAESRVVEGFYGAGGRPPRDSFESAREAAARALELDPASVVAHRVLGYLALQLDLDPAAAADGMRRALEAAPDDAGTLHWLGWVRLAGGDVEGARSALDEARRRDPLSRIRTTALGMGYYYTGDPVTAERWLREALELDPGFGRAWFDLGRIQQALGRADEARSSFARARSLLGDTPELSAAEGHLAARTGDLATWSERLAHLRDSEGTRYVEPYGYAVLHAAVGDADAALEALGRGLAERSVWAVELLWDPRLAALRDDPRFVELAARLRPAGAAENPER